MILQTATTTAPASPLWTVTNRAVLLLALGMAAAPACVITADDDGLLTVVNDSSYVIEELRVADIGSSFFGRDLTGGIDLFPGESISVALDCDYYDILFVDETALECVVLNVDVCFDRTFFYIDDDLLDECAFSAQAPQAGSR
jgi:hypothetical protein